MKRIILAEEKKAGEWDLEFEEEKKPDICPVCSAEIYEGVPVFECPFCGNKMHARCVQPWIDERGTCPICKRPLSQKA
ncbi:MAG: RING finger domain-containing protein [Nitrososphaerota archaeon]